MRRRVLQLFTLAILFDPASLFAEPTCDDAYVAAQRARRERKLLEARTALVRCAQQDCPRLAEADCGQWLREVDAALPTIVVRVQDASGRDVAEARLTIDAGDAAPASGRAIEVDPGEHELGIDAPQFLAHRERITLVEGEKQRRIDVVLQPLIAAPLEAVESRPLPIWIYVVGGLGLASMGSAAYFGITSTLEYGRLQETCAPACEDSAVNPIARKQLAADVSLGAGIASLASAIIGVLLHVYSESDRSVGISVPWK